MQGTSEGSRGKNETVDPIDHRGETRNAGRFIKSQSFSWLL